MNPYTNRNSLFLKVYGIKLIISNYAPKGVDLALTVPEFAPTAGEFEPDGGNFAPSESLHFAFSAILSCSV
jgi:hypothetical protein